MDSVSQYADEQVQVDLKRARRDRAASSKSSDIIDRLPPHSEEAERGVLGCIFLSPNDTVAEVMAKGLVTEWFYDLRHQTIWDAIAEMFEKREAIDLITVQQNLKDVKMLEQVGGLAYLGGLPDAVPSAANVSYYADICREKYLLRRTIRVCTDIVGQVYEFEGEVDALLDEVESQILKISQQRDSKDITPMPDLVTQALEDIEAETQQDGRITGIGTGFPDFDYMTNGLQGGDLIIIAGRPGGGKSALMMNIVENISTERRISSGVNSLEMTSRQLVKRAICSCSKLNLRTIRGAVIEQEKIGDIARAAARFRPAPIFIDDTPGLSIIQLRAKARRLVQRYGIKVLMVDYLQLMHSTNKKAQNRQQELADISGGLKSLAKEMGITVVALCQLNREIEKERGRRPRLADLRESGAIEQDADIVAMLYKPKIDDVEDDPAEIVVPMNLFIAKNRNGPLGDVSLTFFKSFTRFESAARVDESDVPPGGRAETEIPPEQPPTREPEPELYNLP